MGGKQQRQQRWRKNKPESGSGADKSTSFRAPTPGYEKHTFTQGTNQDVTRFKDTQEKLSQYVATQNWKKGSELAKAITEMKESAYTAPERLVRMYYEQGTNTETTDKVGEDGGGSTLQLKTTCHGASPSASTWTPRRRATPNASAGARTTPGGGRW